MVAEYRLDTLKLTPMAWLVGWAAAGCEAATWGWNVPDRLEAMCIGGGQGMAAIFERVA